MRDDIAELFPPLPVKPVRPLRLSPVISLESSRGDPVEIFSSFDYPTGKDERSRDAATITGNDLRHVTMRRKRTDHNALISLGRHSGDTFYYISSQQHMLELGERVVVCDGQADQAFPDGNHSEVRIENTADNQVSQLVEWSENKTDDGRVSNVNRKRPSTKLQNATRDATPQPLAPSRAPSDVARSDQMTLHHTSNTVHTRQDTSTSLGGTIMTLPAPAGYTGTYL